MNEQRDWGWAIKGLNVPEPGQFQADAHTWWLRGATDEHFLELEGVEPDAAELLEVIRTLSRVRADMTAFAIVGEAAKIYGWEIRDAGLAEQNPEEPWQAGAPPMPMSEETPKTAPDAGSSYSAGSATESKPPATTAE